MSRARDRQKKRNREAWAQRRAGHNRQARAWAYMPVVLCNECHGSGRAPDHAHRDALGGDRPIGRNQMCRKCGGDGKVRAGMLHFNVTI